MSEFDGIEDFEGWSNKLLELIDEAERVAEKSGWPPRKKVSRRLRRFVRKSGPNTLQILELDRIAGDTRRDLLRTTIDERLAALASRQAELAALTKGIQAGTAVNVESAASIRLQRARRAVDALTDAVGRLRELEDSLDSASGEELAGSVESLIASIQDVRGAIESAA